MPRLTMWVLSLALLGCAARGGKGTEDGTPQYSITKKTAEHLQKVGALAEQKQWDAALAALDDIDQGTHLNPYEKAKLLSVRASVHLGMGQIAEVSKDLEQALAQNGMPKQERLDTTYTLAQAYFMLERFSDSADAFARWAKEADKVEPPQQYLIAGCFAQAKRYAEALPYATKAVEGDANAPEAWLVLLASLHYELHQNTELAVVQRRLAESYPTKEHWLQLAATYTELGDGRNALRTLETAHTKGMLTESKELAGLAQMYLQQDAPLKGAALLEKHLKDGKVDNTPENLELLALCWLAGKDVDHAQATLDAAGDGIPSGEPYLELGRLQAARGEWIKARDALANAIVKGGSSSPGEAQLLLGVAHYNTGHKEAALASLTEAKRHPDVAPCADQWLRVVKSGKKGAALACSEPKALAVSGRLR